MNYLVPSPGRVKYDKCEGNVCVPSFYVCSDSFGSYNDGECGSSVNTPLCNYGEEFYSCNDNDGGMKLFELGSCTDNRHTITDKCANSQIVSEAVCGNEFKVQGCIYQNSPCPFGCENGVCKSVACSSLTNGDECSKVPNCKTIYKLPTDPGYVAGALKFKECVNK